MKNEQVNFLLHMREFDRLAPIEVIVYLGCELDTRFERIDNRQVN